MTTLPAHPHRLSHPLSLLLAATLVTQLGCSREPDQSARSQAPPPAAAAPPSGSAPSETPRAEERAMRIMVDMTVLVAHRNHAVSGLRAALADLGGYVSNGAVSGADTGGAASFELKVPASRVEALRAAVRALGEVRADTEKAEDVTEARADVQARLKNARSEEARLVAILTDRTGSLADVVTVEKEVARVRETIERYEAEERVLVGQIAMATVKVELESEPVASSEPRSTEKLAAAAATGVTTAWAFLVGSGVLLLSAGPTLTIVALFGGALLLAARALLRRIHRARLLATFAEPHG